VRISGRSSKEYGQSLFVVLRTARWDNGSIAFGETHIFIGPRYLVSVRHGASLSYAEVRTRVETTPQLLRKGPGFVLYALMDFVVDHYFPIVDELEERLEGLEERIFDGMNFEFMPELHWRYGYALIMGAMAGICGLLSGGSSAPTGCNGGERPGVVPDLRLSEEMPRQ
jgi:Mg2+ and Co2+ transporter CorA